MSDYDRCIHGVSVGTPCPECTAIIKWRNDFLRRGTELLRQRRDAFRAATTPADKVNPWTPAHRLVVERDIDQLRQILTEHPNAYIHIGPGDRTLSLTPIRHLLEAYDAVRPQVRSVASHCHNCGKTITQGETAAMIDIPQTRGTWRWCFSCWDNDPQAVVQFRSVGGF